MISKLTRAEWPSSETLPFWAGSLTSMTSSVFDSAAPASLGRLVELGVLDGLGLALDEDVLVVRAADRRRRAPARRARPRRSSSRRRGSASGRPRSPSGPPWARRPSTGLTSSPASQGRRAGALRLGTAAQRRVRPHPEQRPDGQGPRVQGGRERGRRRAQQDGRRRRRADDRAERAGLGRRPCRPRLVRDHGRRPGGAGPRTPSQDAVDAVAADHPTSRSSSSAR